MKSGNEEVLVEQFPVQSRSEAKRLIKQGAVFLNGKKETRLFIPVEEMPDGSIIEVGKRFRHQIIKIRWEA